MPFLVSTARTILSSLPLLFCCCLPLPQTLLAAAADDLQEQEEHGFFSLGWLDQTQAYTTNRANALARRVDRFFGVERSDLEAAYSSLRLSTELRYEESDGIEPHLRLRGRVHLPRINERISLIFSEDKGEGSSYYNQNDLLNEPQSTRVNLEVNLSDSERNRLDFRVGLRSNLKLRTSVRYRYEDALREDMLHRLSQTLYFIDGKGFGTFTQYQFDKVLDSTRLVRWSTELRAEESFTGVEWATSLNHISSYDENFAVIYFASLAGLSNRHYVGRYQLGLRIRRNIARPWLFLELTPAYSWEKQCELCRREGSLFASIRLEMAIGRLQ